MPLKIKKSIAGIQPYIPGKPIEEVQRQLGLKDIIKLASNENPYGPSPEVIKAINQAALSVNRYPDGNCHYLRLELSRRLQIDPAQLIFGNGSDEIIVLAIRALINEGDEVVIAYPSFLIYEIASKIAGAKIKAIPLQDFRYDLARMKKAVSTKTKIIFLGNPDNPAGQYFTESEMNTFLKDLSHDVLVFLDEAYYEYVDQPDYVDSIKLLASHPNIMVSRTFSKMYALAGLRIGYGFAEHDMISALDRIRDPFNVNSLAQAAALACLKDEKYYKNIAQKVKGERNFLYQNLTAINIPFVKGQTNFILIHVNTDSRKVSDALLKKGVIVRDMSPWGLKQYIRLSIGTREENNKFLSVLKEIV